MTCPLPARTYLDDLLDVVRQVVNADDTGDIAAVSFAAEDAGRRCDTHERWPERIEEVCNVLLPLLDHSSPLIREGVVYGLSHFVEVPRVATRLMRTAWADTSPGVRDAAVEALEADGM